SAVAAAGNAINATATIRNHLLAAGIHVFWYRGQLSQLGAEIDAAAEAHTGIPGAATVHVPILIVSDGNPAGIAGISAVFAAPPQPWLTSAPLALSPSMSMARSTWARTSALWACAKRSGKLWRDG